MKKTWVVSGLAFLTTLLWVSLAFAADGSSGSSAGAAAAIGAGLGMGIAAFGCALGQGRLAAAALEGIARNPGARGEVFVPMIIGLALVESLAIYALIIAFFLIGKI